MSDSHQRPKLADLSLEEKASLISGSGFWHTRAIDRLGVPAIMVSDGPHGLRAQPGDGDHVGLGDSIPATCFPTASALGSSFDVELVKGVGAAIGLEARAQGVSVVLGPGVNLKRTPLCGRNFEYFSEDPLVSGLLGAALVEGIQGQGVGASLKHFAANNQETERLRISARVDERTLRELYLAAFEWVVRTADPWTVMCSYNRINGVYASEDPWLLTEVLRHQWGFGGLVVSDWGAVNDHVSAVAAGLDLEMPSSNGTGPRAVLAAVASGALGEEVLDQAVERLLHLIDRSLPARLDPPSFDADAHHELARIAAAECTVLLKNEDSILPLGDDLARVAVIGEFACSPRFQGAGSSKVNPTRVDDALGALRSRLGPSTVVDFAPGFGVDEPEADIPTLAAEAVELATNADVVIAFLGLPPSFESEGFDRNHIDLPSQQTELVEALAAVNDRVIVVLANGGVVATSAWQDHAQAIVEAWLGGQAAGSAIADVLVGRVNPSGRLAETIPVRLEDTPAFINFPGEGGEVIYGERIFIGYRHYDVVDRPVAFPFGHGLSYTTFAYSDLEVEVLNRKTPARDWRGPLCLRATVRVANTGGREGKEVVQCYLSELDATTTQPIRELRGFKKVLLGPGESTTISFDLAERDLAQWSVRSDAWVLHPGRFEVAIGASSRDLRVSETVEVAGALPEFHLDRSSTMADWLSHPKGRDVFVEGLRRAPGGDLSLLLSDEDTVMMLGSFPLNRLAIMMGDALGDGFVDDLLRQMESAAADSTS